MSNEIKHSSATKPRIIPWNNDGSPIDIDRAQTFNGAVNQPQELVYEIGRLDHMAVDLQTLEGNVSLTQLEHDSIDFYLALANKASLPSGGLQLSDFDDALFDIYSVGKDRFGGTLEQTLWFEKLSLNSLTFNIADAESRIERSFEFAGDFFKILRYGNKYLIYKGYTVPSGYSASAWTQVISDPAPVLDPNVASKYIQRVVRVRASVATELELTTDYTWVNGTTTLTILSATTGDVIKVFYTAASWGTAGDPTVVNDSDTYYINADSVTVTLESAAQAVELELDRLTSLNITATLNRISEGVIGLQEKLLKNVETYDVTVALNGRVKDATIQEVLMGQAGTSFGIIDPNLFKTDLVLRVKVFDGPQKTTFKTGYKITGLSFTDDGQDTNANEFWTDAVNLSSDNLLISDQEADIDA
jgi:hypothetical protein